MKTSQPIINISIILFFQYLDYFKYCPTFCGQKLNSTCFGFFADSFKAHQWVVLRGKRLESCFARTTRFTARDSDHHPNISLSILLRGDKTMAVPGSEPGSQPLMLTAALYDRGSHVANDMYTHTHTHTQKA